jgi:inward rectifier potassium channel
MSWPSFIALVLTLYIGLNSFFALIYYSLPSGAVRGGDGASGARRFLEDFFFSGHTLTTVGYGNLYPHGALANLIAIFEAFVGLMTFALMTGFLVARVSRPSARISYSGKAVIAPYNSGSAFMFRIANERSNNLMELHAQVMLMTVVNVGATPERKFELLPLERDSVIFFPLTWTVVHPIDESSPFYGKTAQDLANFEAEIMILIKAFDDTLSQTVHSRFSYRHDEIVWGAKFTPAFHVDQRGDLLLDLRRVGDHKPIAG